MHSLNRNKIFLCHTLFQEIFQGLDFLCKSTQLQLALVFTSCRNVNIGLTRTAGWNFGMPHLVHHELHLHSLGTEELLTSGNGCEGEKPAGILVSDLPMSSQQSWQITVTVLIQPPLKPPGIWVRIWTCSWTDNSTEELRTRCSAWILENRSPTPPFFSCLFKLSMAPSEAPLQALLKLPWSRSKRQKNYTSLQAGWQRNSPFNKSFAPTHSWNVLICFSRRKIPSWISMLWAYHWLSGEDYIKLYNTAIKSLLIQTSKGAWLPPS